jgi:lysyl-tRNA synthetase class 2
MLLKTYTGFDVSEMDEAGLRDVCKQLHIETTQRWAKAK